jgi:hypothetical protein
VTAPLAFSLAAVFLLLLVAVSVILARRRRSDRRAELLHRLLELADLLEADLKTCRGRLQQAHAVMSINPDQPAASEQESRHAIDAGLRSLLQQRIWIRDRSASAALPELEQAAGSMSDARDRLQPLLRELNQAQRELDEAMREHIPREPSV